MVINHVSKSWGQTLQVGSWIVNGTKKNWGQQKKWMDTLPETTSLPLKKDYWKTICFF